MFLLLAAGLKAEAQFVSLEGSKKFRFASLHSSRASLFKWLPVARANVGQVTFVSFLHPPFLWGASCFVYVNVCECVYLCVWPHSETKRDSRAWSETETKYWGIHWVLPHWTRILYFHLLSMIWLCSWQWNWSVVVVAAATVVVVVDGVELWFNIEMENWERQRVEHSWNENERLARRGDKNERQNGNGLGRWIGSHRATRAQLFTNFPT